jgi:hypothetical protein
MNSASSTLSLLHQFFSVWGDVKVDPKTLKVDISGHVRLKPDARTHRLPISFGQVSGDFDCSANELTTLMGSPEKCGNFACGGNQLVDLEGGPKEVSQSYYCDRNQLQSLKGAPQVVPGSFWCQHNKLTNLHHAPFEVYGRFFAIENPFESLEGLPETINGLLIITYDTSLPMLRLLQYNYVTVDDGPDVVKEIINKYAGTGKKGMLGAAVELTKAGYKANARW